jgi:hypothetical protein
MKSEEKVERFKLFAERLKAEGRSDQEIERAFRNFLDLEKSNDRARARQRKWEEGLAIRKPFAYPGGINPIDAYYKRQKED